MGLKQPYWFLKGKFMAYAKYHLPKIYISIIYHDRLKRWINWHNPRDLNEKINWLKFNSDTSLWTKCADKYRVRDYIRECGCEELLIPLYGAWKNANEIDFSQLPQKFVLKPNHGCGDVIVVKDKEKLDITKVCSRLQSAVETKFGYELVEWHYLSIPPFIICEQLLEIPDNGDLIDYKVWCFDGKPYYILTCSNRDITTHKTNLNLYDVLWNRRDDYMTCQYRNSIYVNKPYRLEEMLAYAEKLAKPFPQVRVDFYEVNGQLYVGELTFTSRSGMMDYFTEECLLEMGNHVTLSNKQ